MRISGKTFFSPIFFLFLSFLFVSQSLENKRQISHARKVRSLLFFLSLLILHPFDEEKRCRERKKDLGGISLARFWEWFSCLRSPAPFSSLLYQTGERRIWKRRRREGELPEKVSIYSSLTTQRHRRNIGNNLHV